MDDHGLEEHELIERLRWLISIRYAAVAFVVVFASIVRFVANVTFNYYGVITVILIVFIYNLAFSLLDKQFLQKIKKLKRKTVAAHRFANFQSAIDIISLTFILHFTGSIESPFAFYYIFHLILLGILLSKIATYLQALFAMSLFTGMVLFEFFGLIRHVHPEGFLTAEMYRNPIYISGNLFVLYTTVGFSVWLTISIINNLRKREQQIIELSNELEKRMVSCEVAYEELQQTTLEKARYTRKVSHELKSPLAAIQSLAQTILSGYAGNVALPQKKLLTSIVGRANSMSRLIMDMLTLAKSHEMLPFKKPESVDASEILLTIVEQLTSDIRNKELKILKDIKKHIQINGYKDEIFDLFKNLIENAVKYSRPKGKISIVINRVKKGISVTISDNGIGVSKKEQNLIFEEFYRTEDAKKIIREGTGLGLSIVRQVAEKHKGKVEIYSKLGKGTTFTVFLPYET